AELQQQASAMHSHSGAIQLSGNGLHLASQLGVRQGMDYCRAAREQIPSVRNRLRWFGAADTTECGSGSRELRRNEMVQSRNCKAGRISAEPACSTSL